MENLEILVGIKWYHIHVQQNGGKTKVCKAAFCNIHRISKDQADILVKIKITYSSLVSDGSGKQ